LKARQALFQKGMQTFEAILRAKTGHLPANLLVQCAFDLPGAKPSAGASENDGADGRIIGEAMEGFQQCLAEGAVQGVQTLRTVQCKRGDRVSARFQNERSGSGIGGDRDSSEIWPCFEVSQDPPGFVTARRGIPKEG
jgi:hypothetical protein